MPAPPASPDDPIDRLERALAGDRHERVEPLLAGLRPAQLADLLERLDPSQRVPIWRALDPARQGCVLVEVHGEVREGLIAASTPEQLAAAVQGLDLDELSDIDAELPAGVMEAVLRAMDARRRAAFEVVRNWPDDCAGGLMDLDDIPVRPDATLEAVRNHLGEVRRAQGALPASFDALSVVDPAGRYLGRLLLADLASLGGAERVAASMDTALQPIEASTPAERVARRFEDENLVSAPVVDAAGLLLGRITVDDVLDRVRAEGEGAALAAAGLEQGADTFAPAWTSARRRAVWLGVNLVNALIAAAVIGLFDRTIERLVALAVLMPVVSSMGGVAGTQSLALTLRGLALDQVNRANRWRLLRREVAVGALNGVLWAVLVGTLAALWFGALGLGVVFGAAIIVNLVAGVAVGTLIPLGLERLKVDAAISSGVILVAFTDTFGFLVFLGLAALFLV